jgi:hypothetical protein
VYKCLEAAHHHRHVTCLGSGFFVHHQSTFSLYPTHRSSGSNEDPISSPGDPTDIMRISKSTFPQPVIWQEADLEGLHFYFESNEKRCFMEELPSDTIVEGKLSLYLCTDQADV